jgi:DNA-binding CsgD family transcriptional regulator
MLLGRSSECAALDRLLDEARAGRSGTLVVRGEPGIGKSVLLDYAAGRAADMTVLRARGVQSESEFAFAALHQIVGHRLDHLDRLPEPQVEALRGAFGLASGSGANPFLISLGLLSLLADLAEEARLVCLVDDAHWLDEPSAAALQFVARRIDAEGIALVFAAREGDERRLAADGLAELTVAGLEPAAAGDLLDERAGPALAASVRERLLEQAAGNPLALLELPASLSEEQLSGREPLTEPLPLGAGLEVAFVGRMRALPEETQLLLLVAAADESGKLATVLRAAEALGLDPDSLEPAELDGLVTVHDAQIDFRHPLVRSAVYRDATFRKRQAVHLALAEAQGADDADRRAWHRAAAAAGADEEIARELEHSADRAAVRGGYTSAAAALERAARLSERDDERTRRLLAAAEAAWFAGAGDRATALLDDAARVAPAELQVGVTQLRGRIEVRRGVFEEALSMLLATARELAPREPAAALRLLGEAEEAGLYTGRTDENVQIGLIAEELLATDAPDLDRALGGTLAGFGRLFSQRAETARPYLEETLRIAETSDDPHQLLLGARAAAVLGGDVPAVDFPARAVRIARARGAIGVLPRALERLSFGEFRLGRYASARSNASEGLRLARETGQEYGTHLSILALLAAVQGREDECRQCAHEALARALERRSGLIQLLATWAVGLLELSLGRAEAAAAVLEPVLPADGMLTNRVVATFLIPDYIEASVRAGRTESAHATLGIFEPWAQATGQGWALALASYCEGLLSEGDAAEPAFERALELHPQVGKPFERARTELAFGEALRRNRKRREARDHLRAAVGVFEHLGAAPWEERARNELRATGETARKRDPSTVDNLTPQELQIARLVSSGARNREIAAQLFLSSRTVESHLRKVFVKLGITSRAELARIELTDDAGAAQLAPA